MELFRRTLAGMLMLVVAVSVGIWVQGRFIDAVRLPTHTRMIGATYTTLSDPFYETINDEIQMQIKSNGDLLLVRDPGQDQERQNQEIEDMLNKGIELLIVNPVDYVGVTPALEKAREKGVPVILIDSKVDDPRSLRQKRFLSAMIVVYLFCNMDAATSALHAVTLKQYLAFYSLHTRSVLQLVIESLSALEMILFILYMVLFISQQTSEKQEILNLNQQLQQANEQLRIYAEESAHTAQVQERNRLAREIHDTLGHVLTGITAGADACIQMMDDSPEMARHQMELIADTARNGMNDVRRSVKALRPDSLEKENLSGALNKMCTSMAQSSGAQIQLEESLAGLTLSQDEEDCVYRTVQEGITNAIRHGHATRVQVRCHIEDGVLEVSVRDNGIGCKSVTPGFGLQHMQERMLMLGGTFWYENSDGFCIRAEIPLRKTPGSEKRKQEETV